MVELESLKEEEKPERRTINNNVDRISSLPDCVLCQILSYLPTITSVSTGILSRRWRHVWKDLQVFDIDNAPFRWSSEYELKERHARFDSFVNAILAQRNADSYSIQKFRLTCQSLGETISAWLDAVIGPCLQELYLHRNFNHDSITLPEGIFTCPSLKSLILKGHITLFHGPKVSNVYLPSLKNLELNIFFGDIDLLLSGCPALENLDLDLYEFGLCIPKLQMPQTLKSLTFSEPCNYHEETKEICLREIYTPSLEYLHLSIESLEDAAMEVSVMHFPNMVEAHLSIDESTWNVHWVLELLHALSETKLLALEGPTTKCIFRAPSFEFPEFHHLIHLEVDLLCVSKSFLLNLLHNCHVLERLLVNIWQFDEEELEYNGPIPPTMVPNCVTSHLKSFEYTGYQDSADEYEFIAYVLQRGLVLKTVTIDFDHFKYLFHQATKDNVIMKLSAIPRGSTICQLNFI
ncbi:hypothetical protein PIB30_006683 [Stylosanthes scabra]|uniref:F-box domain-containing protein n=1 Tax=Stylosanthes scabra TaxID=79078 RepID=A0ABU6R3D0_9FABA|nr:hypothetical protein [Stylosanthes scabra]